MPLNTLKLKIDYAKHAGTIINEMHIFASDDHLSRVTVHVSHYLYHTQAGFPDFRYKPVSNSWLLKDFCKKLRAVAKAGDFANWQEDELAASAKAKVAKFATVELSTKRKAGCYVKGAAVYLDEWQWQPLYKGGGYGSFCEAVKSLEGLQASLAGNK